MSSISASLQMQMAQICIYITVIAALSRTAWAQTFYQYTGVYQPAAQQSALLNFYMHDNLDTQPSSAITVVPSVGNLNGGSNNGYFGAMAVFDDALTVGSDPNSEEIGRGRGLYVFNSMDSSGSSLEFIWTAVFSDASGYGGSTISFKGYDKISDYEREIAITGGTGQFRMARGWAVITTAAANGGAAKLFLTAHVFYGGV